MKCFNCPQPIHKDEDGVWIHEDGTGFCPFELGGEVAASPKRTFYTVVWDYIGGDCGDLPGEFDTEEEAERYGEDWVAETKARLIAEGPDREEDFEDGVDGTPVSWAVRHEIQDDGRTLVYDEEDKLMFIRMLDGSTQRPSSMLH